MGKVPPYKTVQDFDIFSLYQPFGLTVQGTDCRAFDRFAAFHDPGYTTSALLPDTGTYSSKAVAGGRLLF